MFIRDPKIPAIQISDVRKDIDVLTSLLESEGSVYVTKNNKVMFLATDPLTETTSSENYIETNKLEVLARLEKFRRTHKNTSGRTSGEIIADMREAMKREAEEWND
jgi:hypothetical protein